MKTKSITTAEAIIAIRPDAQFAVFAGPPERIEWVGSPTGGIPSPQEIANAKAALQAQENHKASVFNVGFTPGGKDWAIAIGERDQDLLAKYEQVLRGLLAAGQITGETPAKLKDKDGTIHEMTTAEALGILTQYGAYVLNLYWEINT